MTPDDLTLTQDELDALGDVAGMEVLVHVGGGVGAEALSIAAMGAHVVALVPFNLGDPLEAETIRRTGAEQGIEIEVIDLEEQAYPEDIRDQSFDIVYVGPMSTCWVSDHDGWAHDLFEALAPAGKLVLYDEHPDSYQLIPLSEEDEGEVEKIEEALEEGLAEDVTGPLPDRFDWTVDEFLAVLERAGFDPIEAIDLVGPARFLTPVDIVAGEPSDVPGALLVVARKPA
ncbi:MAG: class I SAM-dependent methyltransferase [Dehalococcoidia bacterium]